MTCGTWQSSSALIGITTHEQALELCVQFFPDEEISPRADAVLADLFRQP
jgi:hypothetical protein